MEDGYFCFEKSDMRGTVFCEDCSDSIKVGDEIISFEVDLGVEDNFAQSATGHLHKDCFIKEAKKVFVQLQGKEQHG